jgi:Pyruvate/2-oxoacid:ferredoxin oxidoreductase delta subunit
MCEFCHKHGEGKKWYLAAANFSEDLFNQAARESIANVLDALGPQSSTPEPPASSPSPAERRASWLRLPRMVRWVARRHQQDVHWGQVVPLEDAFQIVDLVDWIVRLPCTCRASATGDRNARYCYGIGIAPVEASVRKAFTEALDPSLSVETVSKAEAKKSLTDLDRRGAMHSVWTFKTPFIGGLCNCDRDCGAYRAHVMLRYEVMFRAEYVAEVDPDKCNGCRRCMHQCLWGAMTHSLLHEKCAVNPFACYGCGICRAVCSRDAIKLVDRAGVPTAAGLWGV